MDKVKKLFLVNLLLTIFLIGLLGCDMHLDPENKIFIVGEAADVYDKAETPFSIIHAKKIARVNAGEKYPIVDIIVIKDPVYKIQLPDGRTGFVYNTGKNKVK